MSEGYVFDTYALMEIVRSNPDYERFSSAQVAINPFIFAEFCYHLLRKDAKLGEELGKIYSPHIQNVAADTIFEAMEFRLLHKKRKLSMTDCISYIQAKNLGIKFLTGDMQFESMPNVEFVK